MTNIITACFGGTRFTNTRPAWLIDHGMVLQIKGVELPETYEVDFSNSKAETATRVLGNADGVVIPDQYFLNNAKQIYAWVYLTTGDSGFTTLQITIPLSQRPDVSTEPPTPQETDLIEQAIAALNDGVERAETAADDAEAAVANVQQTVNDALQAAKDSGEFDGTDGVNGVTFTPDVDAAGNISWTNDGGLPNPQTRNIKGPKGDKLTYADLTAADKADLVQGPIADAQTAAVNAVNSKGEEVIQSIPSDYTELSEDVDALKSAINNNIPLACESITDEITQIPLDWENGTISNGNDAPSNNSIRTKGFLPVYDWATLKIRSTASNPAVYISEYDKDQVFLHRYAYYAAGDFTPQELNCKFVRISTYSENIPVEQHSLYISAYYDNTNSLSKLYSDFDEVVSEQQLFIKTVAGADVKFSSPSYEIGANKNNDGNAQYIRKNIQFPVALNDIVHIRCDDITNATNTTPIVVYQYDSNSIEIGVNYFTKAAIIDGIDITPQSNTVNVKVSLYPSATGGLTDTYAVYTNIIIYVAEKTVSGVDYLTKNTARIFKKVVCVGDSYTEGWFKADGDSERTLDPNYAWPHYMSDITGNHWLNCGVSGATTLSWLTAQNGLTKAQIFGISQAYVIGLMINDTGNVPLGTSADIGTDNPTTYYGGLAKIIRELATISPNAHIFVNTCPKTGGNYADFNNAVREVVNTYKNTYKVYCIDLSANANLFNVPSFTGDAINGHYTAIGYEQMAEIYCYLLSDYINNHISTFQDVYKLPFDPVN